MHRNRNLVGGLATVLVALCGAPALADLGEGLDIETANPKLLDVSDQLQNGIDIGYFESKIDDILTGEGTGAVVVGVVNETQVDVRGGVFKGTLAQDNVIIGWQMGEPDLLERKNGKVTVAQSSNLAMYVSVSTSTAADDDTLLVKKCGVTVSFTNKNDTHVNENLADFAKWKLSCDKGYLDELDITDGARTEIKRLLGKKFGLKGKGGTVDIDVLLEDLDGLDVPSL